MVPFVKAHACGNDFLIVDETQAGTEARDDLARRLCSRNLGVGADGVEYLKTSTGRSGKIRLYNADGSIAEISGNGTRCAAAWIAFTSGAGPGDEIVLETDAGIRICSILSRESASFQISSSMGVPKIEERSLSLTAGQRLSGAVVSTGNPHFVLFVGDAKFSIDGVPWQRLGEEICNHSEFPHQTNVEFARVVSPEEIEIRIYERGVGPTSSSGTGTCASAAAAIRLRGVRPALRVAAPGGAQTVEWQGGDSELMLTGPAQLICRGEAF